VKKLWKIFVVLIKNYDVTIIENDIINFVCMLKQCFKALNYPYLHYTYTTLT